MRKILVVLAVSLLSLSIIDVIRAAPARAIYFSGLGGIKKMNPDGSGEVMLIPGVAGKLQLDSPNGHIYYLSDSKVYRAKLDGSASQQIYSGVSFQDFVFDVDNQRIYLFRQSEGIFEYDIASGITTPIYEVSDIRELIMGNVYYDQENSRVYWSDTFESQLFTPGETEGVPTVTQFPITPYTYSTSSFATDLFFDSGDPIPYSVGLSNSQANSVLAAGGYDGSEPALAYVPTFRDTEPWQIAVDVETGLVFYSGSLYWDGSGPFPDPPGIFRSALDGSGFTQLKEGSFLSIALDTADLGDTEDPVVTIFSPIGGTTNSQGIGLYGSVVDDTALAGASWSHNGVDQGSVDLAEGAFSVPSILLQPGKNLLEVIATDLVGNIGSAQVTISWEPLRQVTLNSNDSVREGRRVQVDTMLVSDGEVAGMTFKLLYDPVRFEAPKVEFGKALAGLAPSANFLTPGEVSVTFASATDTVPTGEQTLVSTRLRARSIQPTGSTDLSIQIDDMADTGGNPITNGTFSDGTSIEVIERTFTGDINSNDRLDTGDASRMQSMLTGVSEKRTWDDALNDFNSNTNLDSGDVIRVLRAVVGIDEQPSLPQGRSGRSNSNRDPDAPQLILDLSPAHASTGETVTLTVSIENTAISFSGASFTLDYPSQFIRLESPSAHTPGSLVGGDSFLQWNLSPSQNNYVDQDGTIRFGASSPADWPSSSTGGVLAEFQFTVTSETNTEALAPITIRDAEISTDSGFEILQVGGDTTAWISNPQTFSTWQSLHFDAVELADLNISGVGADIDDDGFSNAVEYFTGTDPKSAGSRPVIDAEVFSAGHCLAITYQRAPWATSASASLQISNDLSAWQDVEDPSTNSSTDFDQGTETITVVLEPIAKDSLQFARLKIEVIE